VRVLVAADSAVVRAGLEALIAQTGSLTVAGSVHPDVLAEQIRELEPDIVLVESRRGHEGTLEPLFRLGPAFVWLVEQENAAAITTGLRSGLRAALPHNASADEIAAAIEAAAHGLVVLHPDILASLERTEPVRRTPGELDGSPTARELEVLGMLAEGLANKNIAWRLGISEHTVKFHITSIFTKLNASSRAEAVAIGMRRGLILL
jgi:two-component system, NarL family, response regulator YdfI